MIIVSENLQRGIIELFIPFCRLCKSHMVAEKGYAITPNEKEMLYVKNVKKIKTKEGKKSPLPSNILKDVGPGTEGTNVGYGVIVSFSMACPYHSDQREELTREQLDVLNKYPVQKQHYRKIPLTKKLL